MKINIKSILLMMIVGLTVTLAGCGNIGKDQVTDTKYQYSVQDAATIYTNETGKDTVSSVFFDAINGEYQYIFTNENEQIIVNPKTGKVTKDTSKNEKTEQTVSMSEIKGLQPVNNVLADAKDEVGGLSPRILSWKLVKENGKLQYNIDVKTTTASKMVNTTAK